MLFNTGIMPIHLESQFRVDKIERNCVIHCDVWWGRLETVSVCAAQHYPSSFNDSANLIM